MTQVEAISALAVTILKGVAGTGRVYQQLMYARTEADFNKLWVVPPVAPEAKPRVRAWMLTSPKETRRLGPSRGFVFQTLTFSLFGYLDVQQDKASELEFAGLTERVADAFDGAFKLGDAQNQLTQIMSTTPAQIVSRRYARFGTVLCHVGQIDLAITVQRQLAGL